MIKQFLVYVAATIVAVPLIAQKTVTADYAEHSFKQNFLAIKKGIYWGYIDTLGNEVSPFTDYGTQYKPTSNFNTNGVYVSYNQTINQAYIYKAGKNIASFNLVTALGYSENICVGVKKIPDPRPISKLSYVVCYLDTNGKEAFTKKNNLQKVNIYNNSYDVNEFGSFSNGLAVFKKNRINDHDFYSAFGYINKKGQEIIPPIYIKANAFKDGYAIVCRLDEFGTEKWGVINKSGKEITPFIYTNEPTPFYNGISIIQSKQYLYGYLDSLGKMFIEPKYAFASNFCNGHAIVSEGESVYQSTIKLIDTTGKTIKILGKNTDYEFIDNTGVTKPIFGNNILVCKQNSDDTVHYGGLDSDGKTAIPFKFDYIETFSCNRAYATLGNKSGFIDTKGDWIILFSKPIF